jgi:hypothetical protein
MTPGSRWVSCSTTTCSKTGCSRATGCWRSAAATCGRDGCSPDILLAAQDTLARDDLQAKLPHLELVDDLKFRFLPAEQFTVVHAHSVFSHSPIEVIDECLANVGRVMRPDGVFDFTFCRTDGAEHQVLREDFYYRTQTLLALADAHGLDAELLEDWEELPHPQSKIRVMRRPGQRY